MSSLAILILWAILGLRPEWQPDACDHSFACEGARSTCEATRDEGRVWAEELAGYVAEEAERWEMASIWDWIVGDLKREYNFERGNVCPVRVPVANVTSRELLDEAAGRWRICWTYAVHREAPVARNCQPVLLLSEDAEYLHVDRCAYGETGLFQVRTHEIPGNAGVDTNGDGVVTRADGPYVLPWGAEIPQTLAGRREAAHDPRTNVHLGMRALAAARDLCCGEDEECRADPASWLMSYNTGRCSSEAGRGYVRRVDRERREAREYACEQLPDVEECGDGEEGGGQEEGND